jgi:hypothetical protein
MALSSSPRFIVMLLSNDEPYLEKGDAIGRLLKKLVTIASRSLK